MLVEEAAYNHTKDMDACGSYEEAAKIIGIEQGFLAGSAWQKQQGIEWISVEVMPKMNDLGILPILITDGKEVKVWYMLHPLVLKTGDFNATHWAYITLPKTG